MCVCVFVNIYVSRYMDHVSARVCVCVCVQVFVSIYVSRYMDHVNARVCVCVCFCKHICILIYGSPSRQRPRR